MVVLLRAAAASGTTPMSPSEKHCACIVASPATPPGRSTFAASRRFSVAANAADWGTRAPWGCTGGLCTEVLPDTLKDDNTIARCAQEVVKHVAKSSYDTEHTPVLQALWRSCCPGVDIPCLIGHHWEEIGMITRANAWNNPTVQIAAGLYRGMFVVCQVSKVTTLRQIFVQWDFLG